MSNVVISQYGRTILSRYDDDRWNLAPYLAPKNSREVCIRFDAPLEGGTRLTDPEHATLLASAKRFLYVRWRVHTGYRGRLASAGTLRTGWVQVRALIRWMIEQGIPSFSEMTPAQCERYAASHVGRHKASTTAILLSTLTVYYEVGDDLIDRLPAYPWQGSPPPTGLARKGQIPRGASWTQATTEVIPSRILAKTVQTALDYIENRAKNLLAARDELSAASRLCETRILHNHRERHPGGFMSTYAQERLYLRVKTSHGMSKEAKALLAPYGFESRKQLTTELTHLRTACYIICAAFSGMRDSELASLEVGCFTERGGFEGEPMCWLKGLTYKLEHQPKPAEWMVLKIVGVAVDVATRLGAPERACCRERIKELESALVDARVTGKARISLRIELEQAYRHQYALMFTHKRIGRMFALGRISGRIGLRSFGKMAGTVVEQQDMEGVFDRDKVRVGEPWPFSVHQFRRSFAVYVARHVLGDVRYLREQFKHWSIDMTLYYAKHEAGVDHSLLSDILTEREELQAAILGTWLRKDTRLSATGGHRIMSFRSRGELKTARDMRDSCRKLGEDVFIRGTGHSWCMASGNGCGGQGLYDAVRCTSCGEGVIDQTHVQVWEGIRQRQLEVLNCPDLGDPSRQRCVEHLHASERVLADLGAPVKQSQVRNLPGQSVRSRRSK